MGDALWLIGMLVVLGGMVVIAVRIEPHWSSKDGRRFICRAQLMSEHFQPGGRYREVRGTIEDDAIVIRSRSIVTRTLNGRWTVHARGETDRRKRHVYLLRRDDGQLLALRIPESSKSRPFIEQQLES